MSLFLWLAVFILSLIALVIASDKFIAVSEVIGLFLGLPVFVIGVIIIGFGTSLPELVTSLISTSKGVSEIVIGNVIGSNITNIFLVLGIGAVIGGNFTFTHDIMKTDIPFFLGSAMLLSLMISDLSFTRGEAIICLAGIALYLHRTLVSDRTEDVQKEDRHKPKWWEWVLLVVTPLMIWGSAHFTIEAVIAISEMMHIGRDIIALTAVALGTSLPEVMVTASAAKKGNPEMAVGNVIGSNIFNTFVVMGIPGLIAPLKITGNILEFSLPLFLIASALLVVIAVDKRIHRGEGMLLLLGYVYFIGHITGFV